MYVYMYIYIYVQIYTDIDAYKDRCVYVHSVVYRLENLYVSRFTSVSYLNLHSFLFISSGVVIQTSLAV